MRAGWTCAVEKVVVRKTSAETANGNCCEHSEAPLMSQETSNRWFTKLIATKQRLISACRAPFRQN